MHLPMTLKDLSISSSLSSHVARLFNLDQHPSLRTFIIRHMSPEHIQAIGKLLKAIGSGVEKVQLNDIGKALKFDAEGSPSLLPA